MTRRHEISNGRISRRGFITSVGVGGAVALAGCTGDDDDGGNGNGGDSNGGDSGDGDTDGGNTSGDGDANGGETGDASGDSGAHELVMVTSDSATTGYAASQGIATAVNENTDQVFVDARPSEGTESNVGRLNREEAQLGYLQNWSAEQYRQGNEPYDQLNYTPCQVFHFYDLPWVFATPNDGWESIMDVESDSIVNPTQEGSGTAPALEHALENHAELEYDRGSFEFGEMAGAMNEGRLDVGAATVMNFDIEPSWLQEMKSTVDLRILGWPDDVRQSMEDDSSLLVQDLDMTGFDGYDYTPDSVAGLTFSYNFVARHDLPRDAVYGFLETMWNVRDELADFHAILGYHEEPEWWTSNAYEGIPFHPGAADFYEEQGIWRDEFERYEG